MRGIKKPDGCALCGGVTLYSAGRPTITRAGGGRCAPYKLRPHPTLHAHHEDYRRPDDVIWLCVKCHNRVHRSARKALARRPFQLGLGEDLNPGLAAASGRS
jgi:hypothetical protein